MTTKTETAQDEGKTLFSVKDCGPWWSSEFGDRARELNLKQLRDLQMFLLNAAESLDSSIREKMPKEDRRTVVIDLSCWDFRVFTSQSDLDAGDHYEAAVLARMISLVKDTTISTEPESEMEGHIKGRNDPDFEEDEEDDDEG